MNPRALILVAVVAALLPALPASADDCLPRGAVLSVYTPIIDYGTGGLVTVKGSGEWASNDPVTFTLREHIKGGAPEEYRVIFQGAIDADNRVDLDVAPTVNSEYQGFFNSGGPNATSPECPNGRPYATGHFSARTIGVRSVLALSPATRTGTRSYRFTGTIKSHAGDLVNLYRVDADGRSILTAQTTSRRDGTYALSRAFTGVGTFAFYTSSPSDPVNVGGLSNRIKVTIR
jgi:hypothetical protein